MSDPGDETQPRPPDKVSTTLTFLEPPTVAIKEVAQWWLDITGEDFLASLPKAKEYGGTAEGSADLRIMGFALSELRMPPGSSPAVQQEVACWFYCLGKVSRLISDYNQGKPGKPDSWHDLTVFSLMARRLQATGQWP